MPFRKRKMTRLERVVKTLGFIPPTFRLTVHEAAFIRGVSHVDIRQRLKDGTLQAEYTVVSKIIKPGKKPPKLIPKIPYGWLLAADEVKVHGCEAQQKEVSTRVDVILNR